MHVSITNAATAMALSTFTSARLGCFTLRKGVRGYGVEVYPNFKHSIQGALHRLLRSSNLDDCPLAMQELLKALDSRLGKMMELRSEADEAEQTPKLSPVQDPQGAAVPWAAYDPDHEG